MGKRNRNYEALHEGVPGWLRAALSRWIVERLATGNPYGPKWIVVKLQEIELVCRIELDWHTDQRAVDSLLRLMDSDPETLWDAVDLLLSRVRYDEDAAALEGILARAGSVWRVVYRDDEFVLERRVPEAVADAIEQVIGSVGKAGNCLASAWHEAYGRNPSPGKAYDDAVKAVEVAAQPVVTPKDSTRRTH